MNRLEDKTKIFPWWKIMYSLCGETCTKISKRNQRPTAIGRKKWETLPQDLRIKRQNVKQILKDHVTDNI